AAQASAADRRHEALDLAKQQGLAFLGDKPVRGVGKDSCGRAGWQVMARKIAKILHLGIAVTENDDNLLAIRGRREQRDEEPLVERARRPAFGWLDQALELAPGFQRQKPKDGAITRFSA